MSDNYILRSIAEAACERLMQEIDKANAENARLKAEVERLTVEADWKTPARKIQALEAEVERLRKHGDAMAETLEGAGFDSAMDFWNAAKEGKQP